MWPFTKKSRMTTEERIASLNPGESWTFTEGAGIVRYYGTKCGICGHNFQYMVAVPPLVTKAVGPYEYTEYGKYKPSRLWYCRSHSNKEIEEKIKELDV